MTTEKALRKIEKYEILEKIGEGGFGIVYKAKDTSLDRSVALKQLKLEFSSSPQYLKRFQQESRLMGAMNHPNIIKILEVREENGRYFIAMDFMPHGSLAIRLKEGEPLSLEETLEILTPIGKAVDYAHGKKLLHRDIKPSNILFMEGDDPVLSDFGLVKMLDVEGVTTTGVAMGTPDYMAPEQILCKELTSAVDLYALGVVAFQMLTGNLPYQGNTPFEIQDGHVHKELPDIVDLNIALPKELSGVFKKALSKDPQDRYATAKEFLQELDVATMKQVAEKKEKMLVQIQEKLEEKEFSSAIISLKELTSLQKDEDLESLLNECQRREKIWKEYNVLKEQVKEIKIRKAQLAEMESWITGEGNWNIEFEHLKESEYIEKDDSEYRLDPITIIFPIVLILLAIILH